MTRIEFNYISEMDGSHSEVRLVDQTDRGDINIDGILDQLVYFLRGISFASETIARAMKEKCDELEGED